SAGSDAPAPTPRALHARVTRATVPRVAGSRVSPGQRRQAMADTPVLNAGVPNAPVSTRRVTAPAVAAFKGRGTPVVMVTAYDAPMARNAEAAGDGVIRVGDTL